MRQTIICTMLFLVASSSFSQQTNSRPSFTQQDYLEKSKKQKKVGTILLIGGASLIATAFIIPRGELVSGTCVGPYCDEKYTNDGVKSAFFIAGGVAALGSVPLFIVSGKNRRKAMSVSFKNENTVHLYDQNLVYTSFPALRVKVNF